MSKPPKRRQQFAAIPFQQSEGAIKVLLITSRDTGRWVVPKGWPMEDKRPHRAAEIEAYEEAGVVGKAGKKAVGHYDYLKDELIPCRVVLFALPVDQLLGEWPEAGQRQREWFTVTEAAERVAEPELQAILAGFSPTKRRLRKEKRAGKPKPARNDASDSNLVTPLSGDL